MKIKSMVSTLLLAFTTFTIQASEIDLSRESLDKMFTLTQEVEKSYEKLDYLFQNKNSSTYSISKISISYGMLSAPAGSGRVTVSTTSAGKISKISVTATVGIGSLSSTISESIEISSLKAGKTLEFTMEGSSAAVMKIIAQSGFGDFGGKAQIKINTTSGWKTEYVEILRGQKSGLYYVWQGNNIVDSISVNMRGTRIKDMKVGDYSLN